MLININILKKKKLTIQNGNVRMIPGNDHEFNIDMGPIWDPIKEHDTYIKLLLRGVTRNC